MKLNKHFVLGFILSVLVIGYILVKLDWPAVWHTFATINGYWLCLGFCVYMLNYLLRAYRFQTLLQLEGTRFTHLMGATSLYGMYLYIMPAKSGEISYPVLLKRNFDISLSESTATLITARFFDFATIALFIPAVILIYRERLPDWFLYSSLTFCGIVFALGLGWTWLIRRAEPANILGSKPAENRWLRRMVEGFTQFVTHMQTIQRRRQYWRLWLVTIGIWLLVYANFYLIVLSLGYQFSYFQMVIVSILMVPMTLLPFQGFANLGTHEIGWVAAFSIFGQGSDTSLAIAVSSHIIMLLFVLLLGLLGILLMKGYPPIQRVGADQN